MKSEFIVQLQHWFLVGCLLVMAVLILLCLLRAIRGPRLTDRIVSGNMIGTMTIISIGLLSVLLKEVFVLDVCLIYAMVSFLAVVVLTNIYLGVYREKKKKEREEVK